MQPLANDTRERLRQHFNAATFNAFIAPTVFRLDGDRLTLAAANAATERWLRKNTETVLKQLLHDQFGKPISIAYNVCPADDQPAAAALAEAPVVLPQTTQGGNSPAFAAPPRKNNRLRLSEKYRFDNFVRGHANEIAFIAAQQISQGDSNINPLFIYGSTGLGKTHLMHAIGNAYVARFPRRRVHYMNARAFMNEVVAAFRQNKAEQFKSRYQDLDLLMVDDIQYIGGDKIRTQEEFFFLFNTLHESNKSLVISCDRAPAQIKSLPQRLITRFSAGLPTHITPPEFEMRAQILRQKAEERGVQMSDEVVNFIAEHIKSNVRELEGAINRISAMANFQKKTITTALCRHAMSDLIGQASAALHPDQIKEKVAAYFHVRVADLSSQKRHRNIALPRHIAIYLCRQMTTLSLPEIGRHFGKRNHTTILHSCREVEKLKSNPEQWDDIKHLEISIKE